MYRVAGLHAAAVAAASLIVMPQLEAATNVNVTTAVVYSAPDNGYNTLTLGLNSASNIASLIELNPAIIVGYETNTTAPAVRRIFDLDPITKAVFTVAIPDDATTSTFHQTNTGNPTLVQVSPSGVIFGTQGRTNVAGGTAFLGTDSFLYVPGATPKYVVTSAPTATLGNTAYSYTDTTTSKTYLNTLASPNSNGSSNNTGNPVGTDGSAVGTITRYVGDVLATSTNAKTTSLGSDGYYLNATTGTTTAIGLNGTNYDQVKAPDSTTGTIFASHSTSVTGMAGTAAVGYTSRYTNTGTTAAPVNTGIGTDSWIYRPGDATSATQIGLTGGIYLASNGLTETSTTVRTNTLGQIVGKSSVYSGTTAIASDVWRYSPSSTPGTANTFGTSSSGTYVQVGLASVVPSGTTVGNVSPTNGARFTNVALFSNDGKVAGTSNRYDSNNTVQGQAAFYFNGTTNTDISPVDTVHTVASGGTAASTNVVTTMNTTPGLIGATASRYVSATGSNGTTSTNYLGVDAYVYDTTSASRYYFGPTNTSTSLSGVDNYSTNNFATGSIGTIGDNGVLVGFYNTYLANTTGVTAAANLTGSVVFAWSKALGLVPLITYTDPNEAASLTTFVNSFVFGSDGTLYGPNQPVVAGTSPPLTQTQIVSYAYTPEPASLGLLTLVGGTFISRRRRLA